MPINADQLPSYQDLVRENTNRRAGRSSRSRRNEEVTPTSTISYTSNDQQRYFNITVPFRQSDVSAIADHNTWDQPRLSARVDRRCQRDHATNRIGQESFNDFYYRRRQEFGIDVQLRPSSLDELTLHPESLSYRYGQEWSSPPTAHINAAAQAITSAEMQALRDSAINSLSRSMVEHYEQHTPPTPPIEPLFPPDPVRANEGPVPGERYQTPQARRLNEQQGIRDYSHGTPPTPVQREVYELYPLMVNLGRPGTGKTRALLEEMFQLRKKQQTFFANNSTALQYARQRYEQILSDNGVRFENPGNNITRLMMTTVHLGAEIPEQREVHWKVFTIDALHTLANTHRNRLVFFDNLNECMIHAISGNHLVSASWAVQEQPRGGF